MNLANTCLVRMCCQKVYIHIISIECEMTTCMLRDQCWQSVVETLWWRRHMAVRLLYHNMCSSGVDIWRTSAGTRSRAWSRRLRESTGNSNWCRAGGLRRTGNDTSCADEVDAGDVEPEGTWRAAAVRQRNEILQKAATRGIDQKHNLLF